MRKGNEKKAKKKKREEKKRKRKKGKRDGIIQFDSVNYGKKKKRKRQVIARGVSEMNVCMSVVCVVCKIRVFLYDSSF